MKQEEAFRDRCIVFEEVVRDAGGKGTGFKAEFLLPQDEAYDAPRFYLSAGKPSRMTMKAIERFFPRSL